MNKEEFLNVVKEEGYYSNEFKEVYEHFLGYQQMAIKTLNEFHRVCEKNKIPYQLAWGSLLGAVRDNGQIPWDYDVDVFVPFEDKHKLIKALELDLDEDYYFYCPEVNSKCRHVIMRLAPKGIDTAAIHVDVFFLIGIPKDQKQAALIMNKVKKLSKNRFLKLVDPKVECLGSSKRYIKYKMLNLSKLFFSAKRGYKKYNELITSCPFYSSDKCTQADSWAPVYEFNTHDICETILKKTDIGTFRIPENYELILKEMYGDYSNYPSTESCIKEVMRSYNRINYILNLLGDKRS